MKLMRRNALKNGKKSSAGKVITGMLVGSVVGATVGWLTAPASGEETRRRIRGDLMGVREKAKRGLENVESKSRELAAEAHPIEQLP
jgi:gas vesicle protein